jgi:hypothetical protein
MSGLSVDFAQSGAYLVDDEVLSVLGVKVCTCKCGRFISYCQYVLVFVYSFERRQPGCDEAQ